MKNALLIGTGSRWGLYFTKELISRGYDVTLITSSNPEVDATIVNIDYFNMTNESLQRIADQVKDKKYDLVFFNHNSGGGPDAQYFKPEGPPINHRDWSKSLYIHSMFPAIFIRMISTTITEDTKVGWMLTGMIKESNPEHYQWGLYGSAKYINLCVMRLFSQNHPGTFFALNPSWFPPGEEVNDARIITDLIESVTKDHNGVCLDKNGNNWY